MVWESSFTGQVKGRRNNTLPEWQVLGSIAAQRPVSPNRAMSDTCLLKCHEDSYTACSCPSDSLTPELGNCKIPILLREKVHFAIREV